MMDNTAKKFLIIEPFYGGSHKRLIDIICSNLAESQYMLITMRAKKWHWRARTSSLYISTQIPETHKFEVLFCTSVLPLAELLGLRPDIKKLHKIVYFHENQLEFPVRVTKERDFQYGFNEILTCMAADKVMFNSTYNRDSFLNHINGHIKLQPDYRVANLDRIIKSKCQVIYYPLDLSVIDKYLSSAVKQMSDNLYIVWPHRWEFDKNPDEFYRVLCKLDDEGHQFKVSILGESFSKKPDVFDKLSNKFKSKLLHCGYVENVSDYYKILNNADVVVSTAVHEFFGVSVLEAVYAGCIPVVPKRLSYKELYEDHVDEMYDDEDHLCRILADLCGRKRDGLLDRTYRHVAAPYDSVKWFDKFLEAIQCV